MQPTTQLQNSSKAPLSTSQKLPFVTPPVDVLENDDHILILADLPGVSESDITVQFEQDTLSLEARLTGSGSEPMAGYQRKFHLPRGIDAERISAEVSAGLLQLKVPKSADQKRRSIQVRAG